MAKIIRANAFEQKKKKSELKQLSPRLALIDPGNLGPVVDNSWSPLLPPPPPPLRRWDAWDQKIANSNLVTLDAIGYNMALCVQIS